MNQSWGNDPQDGSSGNSGHQERWPCPEDIPEIMGTSTSTSIIPYTENSGSGQTSYPQHPAHQHAESQSLATPFRVPYWPGSQYQPGSATLQLPPEYAGYSASYARGSEQEAWTPLRITGAPNRAGASHRSHASQAYGHTGNNALPTSPLSTRSQTSYILTSERGGLPSDSGYGTRSLQALSLGEQRPTDMGRDSGNLQRSSATSTIPKVGHAIQHPSLQEPNTGSQSRQARPNPSPALPDADLKQVCDRCSWTGKLPSDKRKHMRRHDKPFRCREPGCPEKNGFGTQNDLDRHTASKHTTSAKGKLYKCFGENCKRQGRPFPRKDNFKQHLKSLHNDEDIEKLIRRSEEWYQTIGRQQRQQQQQQRRERRLQVQSISSLIPGADCSRPSKDDPLANDTASFSELETLDSCTQIMDPTSQQLGLNSPLTPTSQGICGAGLQSSSMMDSGGRVAGRSVTSEVTREFDDQSCLYPGLAHRTMDARNEPTNAVRAATPELSNFHLDHVESSGMDSVTEPTVDHLKAFDKETQIADGRSGQAKSYAEPPTATPKLDGTTGYFDMLKDPSEDTKRIFPGQAHVEISQQETQTNIPSDGKDKIDETSEAGGHHDPRLCSGECMHEPSDGEACRQGNMRKRFGCTFPDCGQKFTRKADWKRHENTRHFRHQSWYCQEPITTDPVSSSDKCGKIFYRQHIFVHHIREIHDIKANDEIKKVLRNSRIGRNGQAKFWCGFCRKTISLQNQGSAAWDERFDHIDVQHFRKGQDIATWFQPPDDSNVQKDQCESYPDTLSSGAPFGVGELMSLQGTAMRGRSTSVVGCPQSIFSLMPPSTPYYFPGRERPTKRPRTIPSRAPSPSPSGRLDGSMVVQRASSTSGETGPQQPHKKSAPPTRTKKTIANQLFSVSGSMTVPEREPTYIICCHCAPNLVLRDSTALFSHCPTCNHRYCTQCEKGYSSLHLDE